MRTARSECLDWLLVLGRRHLQRLLRTYAAHYNAARPHRGLGLSTPDPRPDSLPWSRGARVDRRDVLGGLIHEYEVAAGAESWVFVPFRDLGSRLQQEIAEQLNMATRPLVVAQGQPLHCDAIDDDRHVLRKV